MDHNIFHGMNNSFLYTQLNSLKLYPVDDIKIDQSFIKHLNPASNEAAIVMAIVVMAKSLNLRVLLKV